MYDKGHVNDCIGWFAAAMMTVGCAAALAEVMHASFWLVLGVLVGVTLFAIVATAVAAVFVRKLFAR